MASQKDDALSLPSRLDHSMMLESAGFLGASCCGMACTPALCQPSVAALQKTENATRLFSISLCLSRACLGQLII